MKEQNQSTHSSASLVEQPFTLDCPHCKAPLLEVGKDYFKAIGQKYWLKDGDSLSVDPCPFVKEKSWYAIFDEGHCYQCKNIYLSLGCTGILTKQIDEAFKDRYFLLNEDRGAFTNYIVTANEQKWIMSRFKTPKGILLDSLFGPYPIPDSLFKDQKSACTARFYMDEYIDLLIMAGRDLFIDPAQPGA